MSKMPRVSGRECLKALAKAGFYLKRQEGSHMILRRDDPFGQVESLTTRNWIAVRCALSYDRRG